MNTYYPHFCNILLPGYYKDHSLTRPCSTKMIHNRHKRQHPFYNTGILYISL